MKNNVDVEAFELDITLDFEDKVKQRGDLTANEIRKNSPKKRSKYSKGWTSKYDASKKEVTVYNETAPTLTHLLENGHLTKSFRNKTRIKPQPHIRPAMESMGKEFIEDMKKVNIVVKIKKL